MSNDTRKIAEALNEDWYTQGFGGIPIFVVYCFWSTQTINKQLGYGYTKALVDIHDKYGEVHYWKPDLQRLWKIIKNKLSRDKLYLVNIKKKYTQLFSKHERFLTSLSEKNIQDKSDTELLTLFKKCLAIQTDSVGIAHVIEPAGLEGENDLKNALIKELGKDTANKQFITLTTPTKLSFVSQEEYDLDKINKLKKGTKKALKEHRHKYFWIQNSYLGPKKLAISDFEKRLKHIRPTNRENNQTTAKSRLIEMLNLSQPTKELVELIDFVTIWQDERKRNILLVISYLGWVIDEISQRTQVSTKALYHLGISDLSNIKSLRDIKNLKDELQNRFDGVFMYWENGQEYIASGQEYQNIKQEAVANDHPIKKGDHIYGAAANTGTAIGPVTVCRNLSSIHKVKQGDILVASMTRPEYMPALKKAAAIVTDEGGITSHAAIVSRELGLPAVIGTKVATKVLKDGMEIEVRANHGFVRVLKV